VGLVDFDENGHGYLINGIVVYHNKDRNIFNLEGRKIIEKNNYNPIAIRYTGEIEQLRHY